MQNNFKFLMGSLVLLAVSLFWVSCDAVTSIGGDIGSNTGANGNGGAGGDSDPNGGAGGDSDPIGSIALSLIDGNYEGEQTLAISYTPVADEVPDTLRYTFTTNGQTPSDPRLSDSYEYSEPLRILGSDGLYTILVVAEISGAFSEPVQGMFTRGDSDFDFVLDSDDVDLDNDGLIEIDSLLMLHNIRYNLAGTSYDSDSDDSGVGGMGITIGAPTTATSNCPIDIDNDGTFLCGYELSQSLSFDVDNDGTWTGDSAPYFLDPDDNAEPYFLVSEGGWYPIGHNRAPFAAIFEGNGHTITGLAIKRSYLNYLGLFGYIDSGATIRNIGLVDNLVYNTWNENNAHYAGGLVGFQNGGNIVASYTTGPVQGGANILDYVGGLVGQLNSGRIVSSFASGSIYGGAGDADLVGGLVGLAGGGEIVASYSTSNVYGEEGNGDFVGALVGLLGASNLIANYASGIVDAGNGSSDRAGALVGSKTTGTIIASYGFGVILSENAEIVNSEFTEITNSTWLGLSPSDRTIYRLTSEIANNPNNLNENLAVNRWDTIVTNTLGAWDFGTDSQIPVLNYSDYDGPGNTGRIFHCEGEADPWPDAIIISNCGNRIPNQDR